MPNTYKITVGWYFHNFLPIIPQKWIKHVQVILFEIDCAIFYTNLHELFCQFISWANWINSGKFMDNCWISIQVLADMKKVYNDLIIINLYDGKSPVLWYHDTFWQYSAQLYQSNGFSWTRRSFNAMIFIES